MRKVMLFSLVVLILSVCVIISREGSYEWSIKFNISKEKLSDAQKMFEKNENFNFHPFCTGNKLIIDEGNQKQFEITEETYLLGIYPLKIVSKMFYKKLNENRYSYDVPLKVFFIEVNFYTEYRLSILENGQVEVEEYAKITGPLYATYIIGKIAYPEHVAMNNKIQAISN
jgi:hypothetical protein